MSKQARVVRGLSRTSVRHGECVGAGGMMTDQQVLEFLGWAIEHRDVALRALCYQALGVGVVADAEHVVPDTRHVNVERSSR